LKVSALIDTGSSVNIISEELYKSLPNIKKSDITVNIKDAIVLANNQTIDVIGTALIKMTISGVHQNIIYRTSGVNECGDFQFIKMYSSIKNDDPEFKVHV
jgi:hypothetical protein